MKKQLADICYTDLWNERRYHGHTLWEIIEMTSWWYVTECVSLVKKMLNRYKTTGDRMELEAAMWILQYLHEDE